MYFSQPVLRSLEAVRAREALGSRRRCAILARPADLYVHVDKRATWYVGLDPVVSAAAFVPGSLGARLPFWDEVILQVHPRRARLLSWLQHALSLYKFLFDDFEGFGNGASLETSRFTGDVFPNRVPDELSLITKSAHCPAGGVSPPGYESARPTVRFDLGWCKRS